MPFIDDELYPPDDVSATLKDQVSPATLAKWRVQGDGPPFIKVGRSVFYRGADVNRWMQGRTVTHTNAAVLKRRRTNKG
jgi:Helix-turn-helix domain